MVHALGSLVIAHYSHQRKHACTEQPPVSLTFRSAQVSIDTYGSTDTCS